MKILKKILIAIAAIIAIALITALFVKKEYAIERTISINQPKEAVFNYIKYLKNQDNYSKWAMMDPNMKKNYTGTDGTIGFISAWESDNKHVGKGEQEIIKITDGERMDVKLRFKTPYEAENDAYFITEALSANETKVTWGFTGAFPSPMNLMGVFMNMDKEVGGDFETGLANLKKLLEK